MNKQLTNEQLQQQLSAAQETILALTKRMRQLESKDAQLPFQKQLLAYQQRIAEKTTELEETKAWSELMIQNALSAIVRVNQAGFIQSWNPTAEQMFGYTEAEVLGKKLENILIPERLRHAHVKNFRRHLERGKGALMNRRLEGKARCKDGSELPVEFIGSSVKQGDISCYVMFLLDISERKSAEEALQKSYANLESLVEKRTGEARDLAAIIQASPNLISIADEHGNVFYLNLAGKRLLGIPQDKPLQGMNIEAFYSPEMNKKVTTNIFPEALLGNIVETRCDFIDQDSNPVPTACTFMALPDKHGNLAHIAVVARDLRDEIALHQQIEHVDRLESLGVLAGGIAHDFNNILTSIVGSADIASYEKNTPETVLNHLACIKQSGLQAANLCNQMLAYSGKGSFIIQPLNLSRLITEMHPLLEVSIDKNVSLRLKLDTALPMIDADVTQIQQVLMNLVINASEAMEKAGGEVVITTGTMYVDSTYLARSLHEFDIAPGQFVYMQVSDNGCGMDTKTKKKLFDPFFTTKFTGRGLGMSAVLGIVNGHHGILNLYSELGKGTVFKVALPVSASNKVIVKEEPSPKVTHQCSGTVLLVDDDEGIRKIASLLLENMGYQVVSAKDGEHALEVFQEHQEALVGVILDMTMPKMNGEDCFQALQEIAPNVRVILSSGYSEEDTIGHFQGKGLAGFIQKPYQVGHFQKVVMSCFSPVA